MADWFRALKQRHRAARARREIARRPTQGAAHGLKTPVVVSLTSYPVRFPVLAWTLRSLLRQTMRPDAVVLWLAEGDLAALPAEVSALQAEGLQIRPCADLRSYKKIIPALAAFPGSLIVTADDDVYYWPTWLQELVEARRTLGAPVICHRARLVQIGAAGPLPYESWPKAPKGRQAGPLILPTGVQGVLYDPAAFHPDVARIELFQSLAPTADDLWLYWMHRLGGSQPVCLGLGQRVLEWPDSQASALQSQNLALLGNDRALAALIGRYGWPEAR